MEWCCSRQVPGLVSVESQSLAPERAQTNTQPRDADEGYNAVVGVHRPATGSLVGFFNHAQARICPSRNCSDVSVTDTIALSANSSR